MAWVSGEQDASYLSNVATTVGVELDSCSRSGGTVTIKYRAYGRNTNNWSQNSLCFWYNGTRHIAFDNRSGSAKHTTKNQNYYGDWATQSFSVGSTTSSFDISIGVSQKYFDPSGQAGSLTFTINDVPTATAPSGLSTSVTNLTRTTAYLNGSYTSIGDYADYAGYAWDWGTSTSYGSGGNDLSGLTPNTTYYYRYTVQNTAGLSSSKTGSFKTLGNAPSITSVSTSPSRTGCDFTINVSYDTNDSFSSRTIEYGTSTNYGSSVSGTSISNLSPNTMYYYKVTINSSQGRSGTYTGNFRTTGNNPTVTEVQLYNAGKNGGDFYVYFSYDTNASFSKWEVEFGLDTNYGHSKSETRDGTTKSFADSSITHNSICYYRFRVYDNFGRVSSWYTGNFRTSGDVPTILGGSVSNVKSKTATITVSDSYDYNASISTMTVVLTAPNVASKTLTSSSHTLNATDLKPGKNYTADITVTDNWSRVSTAYQLTFKTKGGFKFNGKMSDSIKINGKEVIGMKFNGVEII